MSLYDTVFRVEKASTNSKILQKLEPATDLAILDSDGEFYLVELSNSGIRGYVKKELIFE